MIWAASAQAAEELASKLLGIDVRKALDPLDPGEFLLIGEQISRALDKAAKGAEGLVVERVLKKLDVDWDKMSTSAVDRVVDAANEALGKHYDKYVLPKISDVLEIEGQPLMQSARGSVIAREKIEIEVDLAARDLVAEAAIRTSQVNFIRDANGARVGNLAAKAREIVARGMEEGIGHKEIGEDLRKHFRREVPRPQSYWHTVASAFAGRARSTSQIYAYEDAGIQTYQVIAMIDEVTTDQCRFMNGKVFSVARARSLFETLNELSNPEDVKYANPWIRKGKDQDGNSRLYVPHADGSTTTLATIVRSGVGAKDDVGEFSGGKETKSLTGLGVQMPPYHGRCRTIVVAGAEVFSQKSRTMVFGADLKSEAA